MATPARRPPPVRVLAFLAGVVVLKVTASIVANYPSYVPPDFSSDFLAGRENHFPGAYSWAFYVHIASSPVVLVLGLLLINDRLRKTAPRWHRRLGWFQVVCILLLVTPSGLFMARHAAAGPVASLGLALLAIVTAGFTAIGAWTAMLRRYADHRRWMWRSYLLLASAVVLRLMGGLATVLETSPAWFDPTATWLCWLLPLAVFETVERWRFKRPAR